MSIVAIVLAVVLAVGYGALALAKLAGNRTLQERTGSLGFSVRAVRLIGALELAGALGLLAGLISAPLGYAAGTGLVLLVGGAVVAYLRAKAPLAAAAPAVLFCAATVAYLVTLGAMR